MTCEKFIVGLALLTLVRAAVAQDAPFAKGTWELDISGSYVTPIRFSEDNFYNLSLGGGYYLANNFSLSGEVQGYYADQPGDDAVIGGLGLVARWHFLAREQFSLFLDAGGSVTFADHDVPEFGTHFNFTGKVGPGVTIRIQDNLHLIGGVRYFHLSNARSNRSKNPSYDGIQMWAGVMWTF